MSWLIPGLGLIMFATVFLLLPFGFPVGFTLIGTALLFSVIGSASGVALAVVATRLFAAWNPLDTLPASTGAHRFVWNLRYPTPGAVNRDFPISATYRDTPLEPLGVLAVPGAYTVKLTVNGATLTQPLTLKMDPRASITPLGLQHQFTLATTLAGMMSQTYSAINPQSAIDPQSAVRNPQYDALVSLNNDLATAYDVVESADRAPTTQAVRAVAELERRLKKLLPK